MGATGSVELLPYVTKNAGGLKLKKEKTIGELTRPSP